MNVILSKASDFNFKNSGVLLNKHVTVISTLRNVKSSYNVINLTKLYTFIKNPRIPLHFFCKSENRQIKIVRLNSHYKMSH